MAKVYRTIYCIDCGNKLASLPFDEKKEVKQVRALLKQEPRCPSCAVKPGFKARHTPFREYITDRQIRESKELEDSLSKLSTHQKQLDDFKKIGGVKSMDLNIDQLKKDLKRLEDRKEKVQSILDHINSLISTTEYNIDILNKANGGDTIG